MACRVLLNTPNATVILCGSSSDRCRCDCPRSCEHVWDGEKMLRDASGRVCGATAICSRCGMSAMDHDVRVLP